MREIGFYWVNVRNSLYPNKDPEVAKYIGDDAWYCCASDNSYPEERIEVLSERLICSEAAK